MTPPDLILWVFALLMLAVAGAITIVVGYVTFKVLCTIKEKGITLLVICWTLIKRKENEIYRK